MKEIVKAIFLLSVIYLLLFFLVNTNRQSRVTTEKQSEPKTITVTETLTQVMYDTIFIDHFETIKLPVVDTLTIINDSLRIDSVFVEVPISKFQLDTTFTTDTTRLNIRIQNSGYDVKLDSLSYYFEYTPTPIKLPKKNYFKDHFRFGAGIGTGYGCFSKQPDIFLGVGFYYVF